MNNFEQPQEQSEIEKAIGQIYYIRQQVAIMGFNDSEIPELNSLIEKVKNGEVDPEEAVSVAQAIMDNKQDYH
ncbi:hypothetical protein COW81_00595 [Candidatus Campbellbacteria bacterium CG22_combo_CG10-13_8_21_14_all_36_13]|uniref:Antitoxin VbhA domain-containing protein n=1 Tax=Candidatus Campbellbacteria bacterium CG22_combo_CG10-13_8_21_14_all_36_13 TaxID=1974529 RepID=A0A2H0DYW6_9BACT|nr:MAG: hypothetical protein COW81_00595 [Candidatus Campbellbacteria bacterium CG22_combo_CG10-13_8_21_14_all_36_13]